ncbi:MAG: hypothetical protein FRX48_00049 [Lasallia pustulata]|uniref:DUF8004 domain-containing protein n=1 Tax=Lasallia pustulata TaxID=136370 RepID=A0A5M8PZM7_9LECA|nr:MAG: hypothetical protein FRX48_00049 [Lasallia pustulata]
MSTTHVNKSSSRGGPGARKAKLDLYTLKFPSSGRMPASTGSEAVSVVGKSLRAAAVKRWDGNQRTTTDWDYLRRDPELWYPSGDCLVHLYERGQSRRGPSFRLSMADIESSNCRPLLEQCRTRPVPDSPSYSASSSSSDGGYYTNPSPDRKYELYIPAPSHLSREDAFNYHVTTRNFFAWCFEKPLVGSQLGEALITLLDRMNEFRPDEEENQDDLLAYIDGQGYADFRECPDHSLAVLRFAEKCEFRELWIDAFVHCAGMNDRLVSSAEFEAVSRTSKALITRAHLEMGLRLEHAGRSLTMFLEDSLSGCTLGLGNEAQAHLDRFRSFLNGYYVGKYGYWPPPQGQQKSTSLSKSTYLSMYLDFRNLYEYLVDTGSSWSIQNNRRADGGVCVLQNITAFDRKHKYGSLPHPLPLIPEMSLSDFNGYGPVQSISNLFGVGKRAKSERRVAALAALSAATNSDDISVMESPLVREYLRFEKSWTMKEEEKVSSADARKVRWILIYAILQTLISVTRAPKEVRDIEGINYPLCCQTAGTPPWRIRSAAATPGISKIPSMQTLKQPDLEVHAEPEMTPTALDAFTEINPVTADFLSLQTRPQTSSGHDAPIFSFGHISVHSPQPVKTRLCEILIQGYDNGLTTSDSEGEVEDSSSSNRGSHDSSGWSATSSDDEWPSMDHYSLYGGGSAGSCYGDDEVEKPTPLRMMKKYSIDSFMVGKHNPEIEMYISS